MPLENFLTSSGALWTGSRAMIEGTYVRILRFAPSPNGYLHLGHAFSALFTWRAAAALGGQGLLRIEDIDPERSKPEFDAAIIEDLHWLGLDWPEPVMRQSGRLMPIARPPRSCGDLLYPCDCTRAEIAARADGPHRSGWSAAL